MQSDLRDSRTNKLAMSKADLAPSSMAAYILEY
ncbi:hypothetical protein L286_23065 [Sphingobium sp. HDIP04]|nr:hypothetical protein L286_23065 [Sphingobium sp. HDIP04]